LDKGQLVLWLMWEISLAILIRIRACLVTCVHVEVREVGRFPREPIN